MNNQYEEDVSLLRHIITNLLADNVKWWVLRVSKEPINKAHAEKMWTVFYTRKISS